MRTRIVAIGMLLMMTAALSAGVQSGNDLYQQGLARETAGDIKGAIQVFERIVRDFSSNRTLTARALLQLGRWSELLGQVQATKYYERLAREFADQPGNADLVAQARARLAALTHMPTPARATMTVQPLPDLSSNDVELMAVSPDGTKAIVMNDNEEDITLYDFTTGKKRVLIENDEFPGYLDDPVWSPDGQRVAFMNAADTLETATIHVATLDGQSTVVYRNDAGIARPEGWTPDGRTLVVVLRRPDKTFAVGTVPANGGPFTPLRSFTRSANRGSGFRLSPDGRFVAYAEGEVGLRDVHVVSRDGSGAFRITDHPADDFAPIWSPDNRHLAFMSTRSGTRSLWAVEVKDGKSVGQPVKLMDGMQSAQLVAWMPRGIFFKQTTDTTVTTDLYTVTMDPLEGRSTDTPRQIPYPRTGRNISPAWSPDGERLAFVSSSAAEPNRRYVVVMTADGQQPREFLIPTTSFSTPLHPYDLRWFGNGRDLGFSGLDGRGAPAVFRLSLESGEWDVVPVPVKATWTRIEWNFDGTSFYFVRHSWAEANAGIFERGVKDDAERLVYRLTAPDTSLRALHFSPDRKLLAFEQVDGINPTMGRIMILDVGTGKAHTVLEDTTPGDLNLTVNLVGWAPTGDLLVWRPWTDGSPAETLIVPVNGGAPRSIAIPSLTPSAPGAYQSPLLANWSPKDGLLALVRESRSSETFVIENPLAAVPATPVSR